MCWGLSAPTRYDIGRRVFECFGVRELSDYIYEGSNIYSAELRGEGRYLPQRAVEEWSGQPRTNFYLLIQESHWGVSVVAGELRCLSHGAQLSLHRWSRYLGSLWYSSFKSLLLHSHHWDWGLFCMPMSWQMKVSLRLLPSVTVLLKPGHLVSETCFDPIFYKNSRSLFPIKETVG